MDHTYIYIYIYIILKNIIDICNIKLLINNNYGKSGSGFGSVEGTGVPTENTI